MSTVANVAVEGDLILSWQVHLAKEQPRKLIIVIVVAIITAAIAYMYVPNWIYMIAMVLLLAGALSDFFFPTTYKITTTHIMASTPVGKRLMAWKEVKRCYLDEYGVKLSPLGYKTRLEAYRGVYLRFGDKKEEILDAVRKLKPNDV